MHLKSLIVTMLVFAGMPGGVLADPAVPPQAGAPNNSVAYFRTDFGAEINRSAILALPEVADALHLATEQRRSLAETQRSPRNARGFAENASRTPPRPEPEGAEETVMRTLLNSHTPNQAVLNVSKETSQLVEIVERDQLQRLNQIYAQILDGHALGDPVIADQLQLTPEQRRQLDQIREEAAFVFIKQMHGLMKDPKAEPSEGLRTAYNNVLAAYGKKMFAPLLPEQLKAFEELKGEPFVISEPSRQLLTQQAVYRYLDFMTQALAISQRAD